MYLADTLQSKAEEEAEAIHATDFLPIPEPQLRQIQEETAQDCTLQKVKKTFISGWPDTKKKVLTCLHPYFLVRDELSATDGLIFKGQCCVIPLSLRTKIKKRYLFILWVKPRDLGKRLMQMFSHLMVQTSSVWLTTIRVRSKDKLGREGTSENTP